MAINLSPEELMDQAGQMENLMSQYESLFSKTTKTLNTVNANWSDYLANNFSSKIVSAQHSFRSVIDTLEYGANAARTSAKSFTDIDSILAKALGGDAGNGAAENVKVLDKVKARKKKKKFFFSKKWWSELGKSVWEMGKDIIGVPVAVIKMTAHFVDGDFAGALTDCWGLINSVFTFGYDAISIFCIAAAGFTTSGSKMNKIILKDVKDNRDKNKGLYDVMKDNGYDGAARVVGGIDATSNAYKVFKGAGKLGKLNGAATLGEKADILLGRDGEEKTFIEHVNDVVSVVDDARKGKSVGEGVQNAIVSVIEETVPGGIYKNTTKFFDSIKDASLSTN